jgi:hypothetical protein
MYTSSGISNVSAGLAPFNGKAPCNVLMQVINMDGYLAKELSKPLIKPLYKPLIDRLPRLSTYCQPTSQPDHTFSGAMLNIVEYGASLALTLYIPEEV